MPCTKGRSKHILCKPQTCVDEELCPCTVTDAYSCKPACDDDKAKCCFGAEAFGVINPLAVVDGVTGLAIDPRFSYQNVVGVTGGATGATGLYTVSFGDVFCNGRAPVITATADADFLAYVDFEQSVSGRQAVIATTNLAGDFTDAAVSFHAVQRGHC